jgi:hypothetical protein
MIIDQLIIEITRKCNMKCLHCCRGKSQAVNIDNKILVAFFKSISHCSVNNLTLTGGEPSLAVDRISFIIECLKEYKISVNTFYLATNAKKVSHNFLKTLLDMYLYCEDKDLFFINYSNDQFHERVPRDNIELLSAFKFVSPKGENHIREDNLILEGRALKTFHVGREVHLYPYEGLEDGDILDGKLRRGSGPGIEKLTVHVFLCEVKKIPGQLPGIRSQTKPAENACPRRLKRKILHAGAGRRKKKLFVEKFRRGKSPGSSGLAKCESRVSQDTAAGHRGRVYIKALCATGLWRGA